jgi:glycosyltransferase involved in cell wall biosynthesis
LDAPRPPEPKRAGHAALVFIGRISPVKNLAFLIECLRGLRGQLTLDVVGPAERGYLRQCRARAETLPAGIAVRFLREVNHEHVGAELGTRHFFVLPSLGESFGYAVLEALVSGRPVLVSDRTPWRDLQRHQAGWTLPLDDPEAWHRAIQTCIDMPADVYAAYVAGARRLAVAYSQNSERERAFDHACQAAVTAVRM